VVSFCFGYILIRIFGRGWRAFVALFFGWVLVALLYFVLPYEWMFADSSFTEESDNTWIYWLLQGTFFGFVGASAMLASSLRQENATPGDIRKRRRDSRRSLLVLGATVGGVFALLFLVYVFLEHLLAPVVRFFN
jgi:1,4-dihydroxy-2-naphthoate octaprenyltransferase